jgi:leucyl-tRNA synthetase
MDTFVNSSWYYLRYCDPKNKKKIFDRKKVDYWCPIDQYIGGPEHITMHLIYARFYAKFLRDLKVLSFDEPAMRYFTQGIVHGADGEKMSKSKGNVIEPLDMIKKYGADTLRIALVSFGSPENDITWDENIVQGSHKFLKKVYDYFSSLELGKADLIIDSKINRAIKEITVDIENFKHNLAVIKLRKLFESFEEKKIDKKTAENFLVMLHVYCPHITEELWNKLGNKNFVSLGKWPVADEKKINKKLEEQEGAASKLVEDINHIKRITGKKDAKVYVYVLPNELEIYKSVEGIILFAVNDKDKYDPEKKSKKVKPGRPGVYLE